MAVAFLMAGSAIAQPFAWTVNSDDEFSADQLLKLNLSTGDVEFIGPLPPGLGDIEGLAFAPDGTLFAADNATKTLVRIDPMTASAENVANRQSNLGFQPAQALDFGMTFSCDGLLLMVAEQTQSLYTVDIETGQARVLGDSGGMGDAMTAIASYGSTIYALAAESNGLYRINKESGSATLIATLGGQTITDAGLAFDDNGNLWAVLDGSGVDDSGNPVFNSSLVLRIDVNTGAVLTTVTTRTGLESLAIVPPGSCELGTPGLTVPTLSLPAMALLALLLALYSATRLPLRRRR